MRIAIIGAAGGVGQQALAQALAAGHHVTAAVREPARVRLAHDQLLVTCCDARNAQDIRTALVGCEAVICALGDPDRRNTSLYSVAASNIAAAAPFAGVQQVLFLSNFGILDERAPDPLTGVMLFAARRVIRPVLSDHRRACEILRSELDGWTCVRPMALTDGPHTGRYRTAAEGLLRHGRSISRADVADFLVRQLGRPDFRNAAPTIAY